VRKGQDTRIPESLIDLSSVQRAAYSPDSQDANRAFWASWAAAGGIGEKA